MRTLVPLFLFFALFAAQKLPSADDVPLTQPQEGPAAAADAAPGGENAAPEEEPIAQEDEMAAAADEDGAKADYEVTLPNGEKVMTPEPEDAIVDGGDGQPASSSAAATAGEQEQQVAAPDAMAELTAAPTAAGGTPAAVEELTASQRAARNRAGRGMSKRGKKGKKCRIPGCLRCGQERGTCATCRMGHAMTDDFQCKRCPAGCKSCSDPLAETCDTCNPGFTVANGKCEHCAAHCLQCDGAGPGGCNECGKRRMLHVRLELHGEVHECLPCGDGCKSCNEQDGCTECANAFYVQLPNGAGCAISWLRVWGLVGFVIGLLVLLVYCLAAEEFEDPALAAARERARRAKDYDSAAVVRGSGGKPFGEGVRSRASGRQTSSPTREHTSDGSDGAGAGAPGSQHSRHLLPGYSGIEIVDRY